MPENGTAGSKNCISSTRFARYIALNFYKYQCSRWVLTGLQNWLLLGERARKEHLNEIKSAPARTLALAST